jgi:mannose/cellobiose epimerase-like protein (N-acyl-D-glucosamine 2-epimerase family)
VANEEQRLNDLKQLAKHVRDNADFSRPFVNNSDLHMNAGEAFMLIYRLTTTLKNFHDGVKGMLSHPLMQFLKNSDKTLPDDEDLEGSTQSLLRLQRVYKRYTLAHRPESDMMILPITYIFAPMHA